MTSFDLPLHYKSMTITSIFISQVCNHCFSFFSFYPKRSICLPNSKAQRKTKDITIRKSTQKFTSLRPSPCTVCILPSRRLDEEVMAAGTCNSSWFISSVLSRTSALLLAEFVLRLFSTTTDAPKRFFCCYVNRFTSLFAKVLTFSMGFVSLALISIVPSVL